MSSHFRNLKATYALKHMEGAFIKLKAEVLFKECVGFDQCMEIFKEHFADMLKKEQEYLEKQKEQE